jgi:hypothetical protein
MRRLATAALPLLLLASAGSASFAAGTFRMQTTVKDFVTTKWTLQCPNGKKIDLTKVDLTPAGEMLFFECLADIESTNGVHIRSKTRVRDFITQEDTITSETEMDMAQAMKLCDIIDSNRLPSPPFVTGKPRVQTLSVNGAVESILVDLGDGRKLDLTGAGLSPQQLQAFLDLIAQIELVRGVHVAGQTMGGGEDRVLTVTSLTADDVQQLLQLAQNEGIAIPPDLLVFPVTAKAMLRLDDTRGMVALEGDTVVRRLPTEPAPGGGFQIPIEIVGLQLVGVSPVLGQLQIGIQGAPVQGLLVDPRGNGRYRLSIGLPFVFDVATPPGMLKTADARPAKGMLPLPLERRVNLQVPGQHEVFDIGADPMVDPPRGTARLGPLKLGVPAVAPVVP